MAVVCSPQPGAAHVWLGCCFDLRVPVSAQGSAVHGRNRARRPHTFAATLTVLYVSLLASILRWRSRASRLSQVLPMCGTLPLVLSGCCFDLRKRVVVQKGVGRSIVRMVQHHSLAHTVDSVAYSRLCPSRCAISFASGNMWGSVVGVGHRRLSLLSAQAVHGPRDGRCTHPLTHARTHTHRCWDTHRRIIASKHTFMSLFQLRAPRSTVATVPVALTRSPLH